MGKVTGFLELDRREPKYQPASDRIRHFREFTIPMADKDVAEQAARCMDCGIPSAMAIQAARSTTRFRTGMIWSMPATGRPRSPTCIRPTISLNSPAASAQRPVKKPAR